MKRLLTIALAVLFVTSLSGLAVAERTALSIDGIIEVLGISEVNTAARTGLGLENEGVDGRVEQKVNLNVDADMTDNVTGHIGLEINGGWADGAPVTGRAGTALLIDEAYIKVDELLMEQLSITAGVQLIEYSLRDDGNAMFLSLPEVGAFKGTLDYDPLYVDLTIGKLMESRNAGTGVAGTNDTDLYALGVEYYLENESKIQVIIFAVANDSADISLTEYSAGVTYNVSDDLEVFAQLGGQGGEWGDGNDTNMMAFNLGAEYTFSNVSLTPYVGISYQSFGGDDSDENWVNLGDVDETIVLEADRDLRDHNLGPVGKILTTNYSALRLVGGCVVDEKTNVDAEIAFFSKTEEDMVTGYTGPAGTGVGPMGGPVGALIGPAGVDSAIGTEIDVTVTHQLTDDLEVSLAIGYVASGDAIDDQTGQDDAMSVIAARAILTF